jgi:hypothetical protein
VNIRVLAEPIAAPPFAQDDSATTEVDVPITLDVLRNDGDPSGERPTLIGTPGCAGGGTALVTVAAKVTFKPPSGRAGVFRCTYEVTNTQGLRATASIIVSVLEPAVANVAPVVANEDRTVELGEQLVVDLLQNDNDPDGPHSELRVLSSTAPVLGRATRVGGVITFDAGPTPGIATITYQVGDANGGVTTGRLVIRVVEPVPVPPTASDDRRTITGPAVATTIDVLANDDDPDGLNSELRIASATVTAGPSTGLQVGARTITITPPAAHVGDVVVTYVVRDAVGLTAQANVVMTVLEAPNRPPVAVDDAALVVNGGSVTIPIAFNDSDPDGDPLTISIIAAPDAALGAARLAGGQMVFDAVPGASGLATVAYRVDDGEATDDAIVRVTVQPCAVAPPDAPDLFFQTGYQQPIAIDLTAAAKNGDIVQVGAPLGVPSGVYTPPAGENGNVSFTYTVRNACRIQDVGQVVIDVNQDPVGAPYVARIGRAEPVTVPVSVLASDSEPLRIIALEGAPGWITTVDQQRALLIDPAGRAGKVDIVAVIADPGGLQVRVPVSIELVNQAPIARPDEVRSGGGPITLSLLANDSDPDGDLIALAFLPESVTFPSGVAVPIQRLADNQVRIQPGTNTGVITFAYTIVDGPGLVSAPATVTIRVNSPPVAPDVRLAVVPGSPMVFAVPATDPDGDVLTLVIPSAPSGLSFSVDRLTVAVTADESAADKTFNVAYTVTDPDGANGSGLLMISVIAPATTTTTTTTSTVPPTTVPPTTVPPTTTTTTTTSVPPTTTVTTTSSTTVP